jgi:hypothetical protein
MMPVREDGAVSDETPPPPPAPRDDRANLFDRFFPGPSADDPKWQARLDALQRAAERRAAGRQQHAERQQQYRQRPGQVGAESGAGRGPTSGSTTAEPAAEPAPPPASADDIDQLVTALHEQTDVMRALLEADIAIRDDARSTAQNSRTFAVAGIVIAFFTLVAAAVPVLLAVLGS